MSEPKTNTDMTVDDYLKFEERSTSRHEYVYGQVFAMTGATEAHNVICTNLIALFHAHVRGSGCRAFVAEMKLRVETVDAFYYPDIMVTCEPLDPNSLFKTAPRLIVEVLSPSTRHIDRREKLIAYRQLETLREYAIVHQNKYLVEFHQKQDDGKWTTGLLQASDDVIFRSLPNGPLQISLAAIYEGLVISPRVGEEIEEYELA
jgi:Uma2 family endonuclease